MASIQIRKETNRLIIDFYVDGQRCREQTALPDTPANRAKLQKLLQKLEFEIQTGTFDYAKFFPGSRMAAKIGQKAAAVLVAPTASAAPAPVAVQVGTLAQVNLPPFADFAKTWVSENEISWRRTHRRTVQDILNRHLIPAFGDRVVGQITKADILSFRSTLAKVPGRKAETLSAKRINAILAPLRQILNEAADRFDFTTPYRNIKALKIQKSDVEPFTLDEVQTILARVRPDYRNYYTTRFFTGMRTGEIDGLKWKYIDFERRLILVRETIVAGEEDTTKTEESQREIQMSGVVFDALTDQAKATRGKSEFVFCTREGQPLDHNNVTKRVWYPLLRYLGLKERRPYQTRHTAATLWLAAGENPLWIARQLGHASTEMLFKVYSRFVPNLTRRDGSAFERLLQQSAATTQAATPTDSKEVRHE
jgi:integrase